MPFDSDLPVVALPLAPPATNRSPDGEPMRSSAAVTLAVLAQVKVATPRPVPSQTGTGAGSAASEPHALAASREPRPGGHAIDAVAPAPGTYLPAGEGVHANEPGALE